MRRLFSLALALTVGLAACGTPGDEPLANDGWSRIPASPLTSAGPIGMSAYAADAFHIWMESDDGFAGAAYLPFDGIWVDLPNLTGGDQAVAGGDEVFIWGWSRSEDRFAAHRFDPATGVLSDLPDSGLPITTGAVVATTTTDLIVWGGALQLDDVGLPVDTQVVGAALDWATDTWRPLAPSPLAPRAGASVVWTGSELIVWGGNGGRDVGPHTDGAAYDPVADTWRPLAETPQGAHWTDATAVWTGSEMILWGGLEDPVRVGVAYDPAADTWRPISDPPGPFRRGHAAVWTGTAMLVYGGTDGQDDVFSVAPTWSYDPVADSWTVIDGPVLEERFGPEHAWNGIELLIWGGFVWEGISGEYGGYEANGYSLIP
ncbi:MAG: hypothetical protein KJP12_06125 [Acidimicrobiia bacterium]|nr:hypothetical protein [Acidimicrobiia bacterium]